MTTEDQGDPRSPLTRNRLSASREVENMKRKAKYKVGQVVSVRNCEHFQQRHWIEFRKIAKIHPPWNYSIKLGAHCVIVHETELRALTHVEHGRKRG